MATEAAKQIFEKFPFDELCFILTCGLFTVSAFPFDIFSFDFSSLVTFDIAALLSRVSSNFAPFVNLGYVGLQFPTYLVELFLAGVPFGVLVYLLRDAYSRVNGFLMRGRMKKRYCKRELDKVPPDETLDFYEWLGRKNVGKYFAFVLSMNSIAEGLLFGGETFVLFVSASMLLGGKMYLESAHYLEWFVFSIILTSFFYFIHFIYRRGYIKMEHTLYHEVYLVRKSAGAHELNSAGF